MMSVLKNLNQFAKKWKTLDMLAVFFARILPYFLVVFLFFYSVHIANLYLFIYPLLSGLFARFVLNELVHLFYKKQRPAFLEQTKVLIPVPRNFSFPSGHSSFLFGISFFLFFYNMMQLAVIFIIFSSLVGTARVFCGVHWFRDILAGIVVGGFSTIIINQLINYL